MYHARKENTLNHKKKNMCHTGKYFMMLNQTHL